MSNDVPAQPSPFPSDGPVGFEFPADPDMDIPVPSDPNAETPLSGRAVFPQPATPTPEPVRFEAPTERPAPPAAPVAPPSRLRALPAEHPAVKPDISVDPVSEQAIHDLIGITPPADEAPAIPPPPPPPVHRPDALVPAPTRVAPAVPVEDPRGELGALADQTQAVKPAEPLPDYTEDRPAIERLLVGLVTNGGSDMHLAGGEEPRWRTAGSLLKVAGEPVLTTAEIETMLSEIIPEQQWAEFKRTGDLDCAYAMDEAQGAAITTRFRINVFRSMDETGVVFRVIPTKIVDLDTLGILPQVKKLATKPRGLVLFCGPTGSGKSTSMAGLVDLINETRTERIFTLEDPVEFTHRSKKCMVNHREIGADTESFLEGLKRVRREDPDIILIGEMRDYETIGAAIEAADTGHLVIATLHTNSAPDTISRIINSFPAERQEQIRITLAETLLAVICQTLVPSPSSPRGRVVAQEIMIVTPGIANNIRENDIPAIKNALTDTSSGSISLDAHLVELIRQKKITKKEALKKASSPEALERFLGNDGSGERRAS